MKLLLVWDKQEDKPLALVAASLLRPRGHKVAVVSAKEKEAIRVGRRLADGVMIVTHEPTPHWMTRMMKEAEKIYPLGEMSWLRKRGAIIERLEEWDL